jgi:cytochrome c553
VIREELVEAMARAIFDAEYRDVDPLDRDIEWLIVKSTDYSRERGTVWHHQAAAALSVALDAILEPIEALHYPANRNFDRTPICADCHGKAGTHPCGCWAEYDRYPICGECGEQDHMPLESDDYPCPTRRLTAEIRGELSHD